MTPGVTIALIICLTIVVVAGMLIGGLMLVVSKPFRLLPKLLGGELGKQFGLGKDELQELKELLAAIDAKLTEVLERLKPTGS